jgi:hypothetical protein
MTPTTPIIVYVVQKAYDYDNIRIVTTNKRYADEIVKQFGAGIDGILIVTEHEVII